SLADNHVVDDRDPHYLSCIYDLLRYLDIRDARSNDSGRMIMHEYDRRRTVFYSRLEYFSRMNDIRIERAHRQHLVMDDLVVDVEIYPSQIFLRKIVHVPDIIRHVLGVPYAHSSPSWLLEKSSPK